MRVDGWYPGESAVKIERKAEKFRQQMSAAAEEKKRKQESARINYQVNKILQQETTADPVPGTGFSGGQRGGFYTKDSSGGNSGGTQSFLDDYMDTQKRSADAIIGGLGRYLGNQLDAIGTQYQRWQPMRSGMNAEMSSWKQGQYESELRSYYSMLEENLENPGTYTQAALENQQRIVGEAAEQANIFGLVDEIQRQAGNAVRDLSMETWLKSQNRVERAAAGEPEILQKLLHAQAGFSEMVPSLLAYEYFGALPGALLHSGSRYGATTMLARAKQQPLETQHRAGSVAGAGGLLAGALAGATQYGLGNLPPIVSSQAAPLIQAASDGLPAAAYALGETGMSELGRTKADPEYQFDWKNVGRSALTAWALGAGGSLYDRFASGGYQAPADAAGFGRDQPSVGGGAGGLPRLPPGGGGTASPGTLPAVGPGMAAANAGNSGMTVQKRADIVNFMQGLQKSGMPASEAIQLAIDLADIKQGTWKKNQSLAEQKSDTLTEEEFDAAFEKGFNYDIMQEIREGYSEKLKEELKSGRAREESKEEFIRRAAKEGYTTYDRQDACYGFRRVRDTAKFGTVRRTETSFKTQKELMALGIQSDVIEGDILWNKADITRTKKVTQAATLNHGYIVINSEMNMSPKEVAGHEAFHLWKSGNGRDAYIAVLNDNLLFSSSEFMEFQSKVSEYYLGEKEVPVDDDYRFSRLMEEVYAYISGMIYEGTEEAYLRLIIRDYDLVKSAWYELIRKNR